MRFLDHVNFRVDQLSGRFSLAGIIMPTTPLHSQEQIENGDYQLGLFKADTSEHLAWATVTHNANDGAIGLSVDPVSAEAKEFIEAQLINIGARRIILPEISFNSQIFNNN